LTYQRGSTIINRCSINIQKYRAIPDRSEKILQNATIIFNRSRKNKQSRRKIVDEQTLKQKLKISKLYQITQRKYSPFT
jgi:hypothetical protein